jgi:hypothetical protein
MKHEYDFESITDKDRVGAVRIIRRPLAKEAHDGNQGKCTLEFHALSFDQTTWRQFNRTPIFIRDGRDVRQWDQCQVGCRYAPSRTDSEPPFDTSMGGNDVLLSMESAVYYPSIALEAARQAGVRVVMTTNLKSDVPVGYFSW